jgi:putative ABC transport system permease protein
LNLPAPRSSNKVMALNDANRSVSFVWLERLWQDVTYGCRMLAANPGFTLVAVISLALGVGANCAAFSWADALLLRPLTVARPGEVVTVGSAMSVEGFSSISTSYREYVDIRDQNTSFDGLVAFTSFTSGLAPERESMPKLTLGMLVSGNFFDVMGVEPELGRAFRAEEDQVQGRDAVVVIGHSLWEKQFSSDPAILGRRVLLSGIEFTVIGVAPQRFTGMNQYVRSDFYAPLMMWPRLASNPKFNPLEDRSMRNVTIKGRLKPDVTLERAQTELSIIAKDLERAYPDTNRNRGLIVRTELQTRLAQSPPDAMLIAMLTTLAAAVLFVACANVAGLLTSRAPARAKEMAMRVAVGAGRGRLITQLMTESLLVALAGGALGIAVGYGGVMVFRQIQLPTDLPVALTFQLDRRAMTFSLIIAGLSAILFGLAPAIQTSRTDLAIIMKGGETMAGRRRRWGRSLLVGGQVATSVVLLVMATFMYRGFREQVKTGPGYRTDHLLLMSLDPSLARYSEEDTRRFFLQLAERARSVPGVKSAALASTVPMATEGIGGANVIPEGFQLPPGRESVALFSARVDEHYFTTMNIPVVQGRGFREQDSTDAPRVAVVNEEYVRQYLPNQDPLGKRFQLVERSASSWVEIVGVARTAKYLWLGEPPTQFVYLPYRQFPRSDMVLITESFGDASSLAAPLREVIQSLDQTLPIYNVRTMEEFYQMRTISIFNVIVGIVAAMGLMGLSLAIVGLYGLVAYATTRRTKEIGIRMAIGAGRTTVLRMVLRQGLVLAIIGLVIGLFAGFGAERLLQAAFPNGDNRIEFMAYVLVAPVVLAATFIAAYLPAHRAARLDPMKALRYE